MIEEDKLNDSIFNNVNGYKIDINQRKVILNRKENILVVAGAGSGKTLTILGKIKYLIERENINYQDILCISFTNESVNNLKNKLEYPVDVYTFHKLGLEILKDANIYYQIAPVDLLKYIVNEYFESLIEFKNYEVFCINYFQYLLKRKDLTLEKIKKEYKKEFLSYKKLIIKFLQLFQSNKNNLLDIKKYLKKNKYFFFKKKSLKNISFLIITLDIYNFYLEELYSTSSLDFDMMINLAHDIVIKKGIKKCYKYIIIDEFQDTSILRYELIKVIKEKCHSKLLVVGDDFQSIYEFSGCTLELFVNFKKYFYNSEIVYLNNVYRNSKELIKISYQFIKKNPYQLRKKLVSFKSISNPIKIVYYSKFNYKIVFLSLLEKLYKENKKDILVLGRCNNDIDYVYSERENNYLIYKDIKIKYLTVHKAKGLEADYVIVLNLCDDILGFPNKIEDDEIISSFFKKDDSYLYASERRLFYVALTRTRNEVYLLTNKRYMSCFVKEIKNKCEIINI